MKYVVCLCGGCDGCCVFCLYCGAWSCRCSCMGSVSVSSCRCCMFVSCVHPMAVLNAAFCTTCSLLMLVEDTIGDHTEEAYSRAGLITALWVAMSVSFCLPNPVVVSPLSLHYVYPQTSCNLKNFGHWVSYRECLYGGTLLR